VHQNTEHEEEKKRILFKSWKGKRRKNKADIMLMERKEKKKESGYNMLI
jgi:hypothetical protein